MTLNPEAVYLKPPCLKLSIIGVCIQGGPNDVYGELSDTEWYEFR